MCGVQPDSTTGNQREQNNDQVEVQDGDQGGEQNQDNDHNAAVDNPAGPVDPFPQATAKMDGTDDDRKDFLKQKLVTAYKNRKDAEHLALQQLIQRQQQQPQQQQQQQNGSGGGNQGGNAPAPPVAPEDMKWGKVDHFLNDSGFTTIAKVSNAIVAGGDGVANGFFGDEQKAVDADRYGYNTWDFLYSGMGAVGNTARLITNSRKRDKMKADANAGKLKKKNEAEQKALSWDSFANSMTLLGNLSEMGVAGAGFFDTDNNDKARLSSKILAPAAGWFNAIGSIGSAIGKRSVNRNLVKGLEQTKLHDCLGTFEQTAKNAASNKQAPDYLKKRAEFKKTKAQKYALDQAQRFHESNGKGLREGDFSAVFNTLSAGALTFASIFDKMFDSPVWKGIKGALPALSIGVDLVEKLALKRTEKNRVERNKKIRQELLKEYLEKKKDKILEDAKKEMGDANANKITNNEFARIALARLGVAGIEIDKSPLSDQNKADAYDIITDKRAQNILDSPKADRENFLDALFLPPDASKNDIIKALNGE